MIIEGVSIVCELRSLLEIATKNSFVFIYLLNTLQLEREREREKMKLISISFCYIHATLNKERSTMRKKHMLKLLLNMIASCQCDTIFRDIPK